MKNEYIIQIFVCFDKERKRMCASVYVKKKREEERKEKEREGTGLLAYAYIWNELK